MEKRELSLARLCCLWFDTMATAEEKSFLKTSDNDGDRNVLVHKLHSLLVARISTAFTDNGHRIPKALSKPMSVGLFSTQKRTLADLGVTLEVTPQAFASFRKEYEADQPSAKRVAEQSASQSASKRQQQSSPPVPATGPSGWLSGVFGSK